MTYTEQAAKRNYCMHLTGFVRLVDYLVATSLQSLAVDATQTLKGHLEDLIKATELAEERRKQAVADAAAAALASTSSTNLLKSRSSVALPTASTILTPSKMKKDADDDSSPMFKVELLLSSHNFAFEPAKEDFANHIHDAIGTFQECVTQIQALLKDDVFNVFTRPTINKRQEDLTGDEAVDLTSILEDDVHLANLTNGVHQLIEDMFTKCNTFASSLEKFREMVSENANLDLNWVENTDHTPQFFSESLSKYKQMYSEACAIQTVAQVGPILIDCTSFKNEVMPSPLQCLDVIQRALPKNAAKKNAQLLAEIGSCITKLEVEPTTTAEYVDSITYIAEIERTMQHIEEETKTVTELYELVERFSIDTNPEDLAEYQTLRNVVQRARDASKKRLEERDKLINRFCDELDKDISNLGSDVLAVRNDAQADIVTDPEANLEQVLAYMEGLHDRMNTLQERAAKYKAYQKQFNVEVTKFTALEETHTEIRSKKLVWESVRDWNKAHSTWETTQFESLNADEVSSTVNRMIKQVYTLSKSLPTNEVIPTLQVQLEKMKDKLPLITDLRNPALKARHWERIDQVLGQALPHDETFNLALLDQLEVWKHKEAMQEVSTAASSEASLETMLKKVDDAWKKMEFPVLPYRDSKDVFILGGLDEVQALLDDSQVNISTIAGSRHVGPIKPRVEDWQRQLNLFAETLEEWLTCQRSWLYLESIFSAPDIQRQLPVEAKMFLEVDKSFKEAMRKTVCLAK